MEVSKSKMSEIAMRIHERRKELGYSYQDFATLTGMNKSSLQRYETGGIENIPLHRLESIARALNVTPAWLMGWENKSGEIDLGLACLDISKIFEVTLEEAETAMDGMVFPNGITFSALEEIYYRLKNPTTSPSFKLLSASFEMLNDEGRERLTNYADDLVSSGKYKK